RGQTLAAVRLSMVMTATASAQALAGTLLQPNIVIANLAIERRRVHAEQLGGARLMAAGNFQGAANQLDLKTIHFVVEGNAARQIDLRGEPLAAGLRGALLRIQYFFTNIFAAQLTAARNDDGALDDVFEFADVAGPVIGFERR